MGLTPARTGASLAVGLSMNLLAGTVYSLGIWGEALAARLAWTPTQFATFEAFLDLGLYITPHLGMLIDRTSPRVGGAVSACMFVAGWGGMALMAHLQPASALSLPICSASAYLVGGASGCAFMSAVHANVDLLGPRHKGLLNGLLVSGFGMSSVLVGRAWVLLCHDDPRNIGVFLAALATLCSAAALAGACLLATPGDVMNGQTTESTYYELEGISGDSEKAVSPDAPCVDISSTPMERPLGHPASRVTAVGGQYTPRDLLQCSLFYLLFTVLACTLGAFLLWSQQGQHALALAEGRTRSPHWLGVITTTLLVGVASRLAGGRVSDWLPTHVRMPRSTILLATAIFAGATYLLVMAAPGSLWVWYAGGVCMGVAEGLSFAVWPSLVREVWGTHNFALNFSIVNMAIAAGGISLTKGTAAWVGACVGGSEGASSDSASADDVHANDVACFTPPFLLVVGLNAAALVAAGVFACMTRPGREAMGWLCWR